VAVGLVAAVAGCTTTVAGGGASSTTTPGTVGTTSPHGAGGASSTTSASTVSTTSPHGAGGAGGGAATGHGGAGACAPMPSGVLSFWRGEGDLVDSVGPNSGVAKGTVSFVKGVVGQAMRFGGDAYVLAGAAGLPTGNADRTIELWAEFDDEYPLWNDAPAPHSGLFYGYGQWGAVSGTSMLFVSGVNLADTLGFSQWGQSLTGPVPGTRQVWAHLAATVSQGMVTLYVDGAVAATQPMLIDTPPGGSSYLGGHPGPPDGKPEWLIGAVDEVAVYGRALGAGEIAAIHAAGAAGKCH
jgi:hypothetical protein